MYEDMDIADAMKSAGACRTRVREGDDGFGWIDALRDVAREERKSRVKGRSGAYPVSRGAVGNGKKEKPLSTDRLALLKQAQAKVDAQKKSSPSPGCSTNCGSPDTGWKGMCQACYDKARPERWRGGKYHKVSYRNHEPVFRMVQAMAKQERRSVSEMIMVLVTAEIAKRMQEQAGAPPRRKMRRAGSVV